MLDFKVVVLLFIYFLLQVIGKSKTLIQFYFEHYAVTLSTNFYNKFRNLFLYLLSKFKKRQKFRAH